MKEYTKTVSLTRWDIYEFEGNLESIITGLQGILADALEKGCTSVQVDYDRGYEFESPHVNFTGIRPENAKEKAARAKKAARQKVLNRESLARRKKAKEEADRKEWERLRAKFG